MQRAARIHGLEVDGPVTVKKNVLFLPMDFLVDSKVAYRRSVDPWMEEGVTFAVLPK